MSVPWIGLAIGPLAGLVGLLTSFRELALRAMTHRESVSTASVWEKP